MDENYHYGIEFTKYFYRYASVRDLIQFLEKACEHFLQLELIKERSERIEKIVNLKKEKYIASFTVLGPVLSIALSLIFSLPTLQQILIIIGYESHLLKFYIGANIFFTCLIMYFFRDQLNEAKYELTYYIYKYLDKFLYVYYHLGSYIYLKVDKLAIFMNRDVKDVFTYRRLHNLKWTNKKKSEEI